MEAPGALVEARVPSVNVPVCAVKGVSAPPCVSETPCVEATPCVSGVVASVPGCVLPRAPCVKEAVCVSGTTCAPETVCVEETARVCEQPRVSERLSVRETACVRSLYVREMTVGMREHASASPGVNVMEWCLSVVTRRCAWVEWRRRRRRQTKDKGRVAAVAISGTAPGRHSSEREVRTVPGTRPPRARLRE